MKEENVSRAVRYIESWVDYNFPFSELPGLVVCIQKGDQIILNKAWGFANLQKKTPMRSEHIFRIASHSKMFTAISVLQLVEKKKIKLDKPLAEYLPWLLQPKDKNWRKLTVRDLLEHAAGVTRDGEESEYWQLRRPFPDARQLKTELRRAGLVFKPQQTFKYSNYGFSLLGLLIEEVSGQTFKDYIQKNILSPLIMRHTGADIESIHTGPVFAVGYNRKNKKGVRKPLPNVGTAAMAPATGVYATAKDVSQLAKIFYQKNSVLSRKSIAQMTHANQKTTKGKNNDLYGLGCEIHKIEGKTYVGHSGGFPGFITNTFVDPKEKLSIVVLTNAIDGGAKTLGTRIVKILQFFDKQKFNANSKKLDVYEGRYENIWGITDVINIGKSLASSCPTGWGVPTKEEQFVLLSKGVFTIENKNGYFSPGEKLSFMHSSRSKKINKIIYAGSTSKRIG